MSNAHAPNGDQTKPDSGEPHAKWPTPVAWDRKACVANTWTNSDRSDDGCRNMTGIRIVGRQRYNVDSVGFVLWGDRRRHRTAVAWSHMLCRVRVSVRALPPHRMVGLTCSVRRPTLPPHPQTCLFCGARLCGVMPADRYVIACRYGLAFPVLRVVDVHVAVGFGVDVWPARRLPSLRSARTAPLMHASAFVFRL